MIGKMIRAARLDRTLYTQVENDETETTNAMIIVVLVGIISGIGAAIGAVLYSNPLAPNSPVPNPITSFIGTVLGTLIGWVVWAVVIYFVGTRVYHATMTTGELLPTLGYAQTPLLLNILSGIPCWGSIISMGAGIWSLVTSFIATREALDLDNGKTFITIILAGIAVVVVYYLITTTFGIGPVIL
jgi:hypothetical protein